MEQKEVSVDSVLVFACLFIYTSLDVPLEYIVGEFDSKYRARALYPCM